MTTVEAHYFVHVIQVHRRHVHALHPTVAMDWCGSSAPANFNPMTCRYAQQDVKPYIPKAKPDSYFWPVKTQDIR